MNMLTFPSLNTGAVAQYPLPVTFAWPVEVIRFIDGSDQRFLTRGNTLRAWHVQLSALSEDEIFAVEQFMEALQGQYSLFNFPDPYSGQPVANCRLGSNTLATEYLGVGLTATDFWVVETNG
jgi:hypothetical protein